MSTTDTDVVFENPKLASAFASYLHQLLPLLDAGGEFADYYRHADMEAVDRFVVRLHKPLPPRPARRAARPHREDQGRADQSDLGGSLKMVSPESRIVASPEVDLFYQAQLAGSLVPFLGDRPLFVTVAGYGPRFYLPIFSSERWLHYFVTVCVGVTYDRTRVIRNCRELVDEMQRIGAEFAFNPSQSKDGTCVFREIRWLPA